MVVYFSFGVPFRAHNQYCLTCTWDTDVVILSATSALCVEVPSVACIVQLRHRQHKHCYILCAAKNVSLGGGLVSSGYRILLGDLGMDYHCSLVLISQERGGGKRILEKGVKHR